MCRIQIVCNVFQGMEPNQTITKYFVIQVENVLWGLVPI